MFILIWKWEDVLILPTYHYHLLLLHVKKNLQVFYLPVNSSLDMAVEGILDDSSSVEVVEILKIIFIFFYYRRKKKENTKSKFTLLQSSIYRNKKIKII